MKYEEKLDNFETTLNKIKMFYTIYKNETDKDVKLSILMILEKLSIKINNLATNDLIKDF